MSVLRVVNELFTASKTTSKVVAGLGVAAPVVEEGSVPVRG